jgi:putative membrane protein
MFTSTLADCGPGPWFLIFPLLWFGVLALAVFRFARFGPPWRNRDGDRGRSVLDEMYARGEIDADEYRRRRDVLQEAGQ